MKRFYCIEVEGDPVTCEDWVPPLRFRGVASAQVIIKKGIAEVDNVYVNPTRRNYGLGSRIMAAICADADREGLELELFAAPDAGKAEDLLRFYEAHGFLRDDPSKPLDHRICQRMTRKPVPHPARRVPLESPSELGWYA